MLYDIHSNSNLSIKRHLNLKSLIRPLKSAWYPSYRIDPHTGATWFQEDDGRQISDNNRKLSDGVLMLSEGIRKVLDGDRKGQDGFQKGVK